MWLTEHERDKDTDVVLKLLSDFKYVLFFRPVSKKMARDPLQDRVKSRRDPIFIKQKVIVFIPTSRETNIFGKRIFKSFQTGITRQLGFE